MHFKAPFYFQCFHSLCHRLIDQVVYLRWIFVHPLSIFFICDRYCPFRTLLMDSLQMVCTLQWGEEERPGDPGPPRLHPLQGGEEGEGRQGREGRKGWAPKLHEKTRGRGTDLIYVRKVVEFCKEVGFCKEASNICWWWNSGPIIVGLRAY